MIAFNPPRQFTLPEVQMLFRALFTHLEAPDVYGAEGIFRIPGTHESIVKITENILHGKPFIHPEYKVHDYIGALKYGLMNCVFNKDDKLIQELKLHIEKGDETADIEAIKIFVKALVNSDEKAKYAAGEVIYDYLHFLTRVAGFAVKNHMDEENLGKMVGPLFANLIEEDPKALLGTIKIANRLCTRFIKEKHFEAPFKQTFPEQFEKWRTASIAELETQIDDLKKLDQAYNARLTVAYDDLVNDQNILHQRNQKAFASLSKKTKNLKEEVERKQKSLQELINEQRDNALKIKQLEVTLNDLQQEMLKESPKPLVFSQGLEPEAPKPEELKKKRVRKVKLNAK